MKTQENNKNPKDRQNKKATDKSDSSDRDQTNEEETGLEPKADLTEDNDHTEWKDPDITDPKVSPEKVQDPVAKNKSTPDTLKIPVDTTKNKTNENVTALGITEHHSPVNKLHEEKHTDEYAGIEEEEEEEDDQENREEER